MNFPVRVDELWTFSECSKKDRKKTTIQTQLLSGSTLTAIYKMRMKRCVTANCGLCNKCYQHLRPGQQSVGRSGFLALTHSRWLTPYLIEKASLFYIVTKLTIIVMPGCKCQRISVSSALLGSARQHLIDVSACKQSRRPYMRIFTHAFTWKAPLVAQ